MHPILCVVQSLEVFLYTPVFIQVEIDACNCIIHKSHEFDVEVVDVSACMMSVCFSMCFFRLKKSVNL